MPDLIAFIQWQNFAGQAGHLGLFQSEPLAFNSNQERLHLANPGDRLWLVSRCPEDCQYYLVAVLAIASQGRNPAGSSLATAFGEFRLVADRSTSVELKQAVPIEGVLRALTFDPAKPVRHGSSLGQALQTVRVLTAQDVDLLQSEAAAAGNEAAARSNACTGLWTKCNREYAEYFRANAFAGREPQAFLLYDSPPPLLQGATVFIHSDKAIRLVARFKTAQFVSGHRFTCDSGESEQECVRIWRSFREKTVNGPSLAEFRQFWSAQFGVRGLFLMDRMRWLAEPVPFKSYSRALDWGYPTGVGYRLLNAWQCACLTRACGIGDQH